MAVFLKILVTLFASVYGLDNGVARTPPMGWLAWERFACNTDCTNDPDNCISEKLFKDMADHMVSDGYKDVGYQFINIDDCWASRDRDSEGNLQADPIRFPSGIKALADYIHNKGLKMGIYADFGTHTCAGYPGSQDHLQQDVMTFAEWGIDMLKMDGCSYSDLNSMPQGYMNVSNYLNGTGRHIVFSCSWPAYWNDAGMKIDYTYAAKSCNLWRLYGDISDSWDSVKGIVQFYTSHQDEFQPVAGPGNWNDPDMLIIGGYGLSVDEQKAQFAIWSVLAAPLLMSNDLRNIPKESQQILQNMEIINVNQDSLGKQARKVSSPTSTDLVLSKPLANGSYAVVFLNEGSFSGPHNITIDFKTVGLTSSKAMIRDLFQQKNIGTFESQYTACVNPSGVVMVTMTPV